MATAKKEKTDREIVLLGGDSGGGKSYFVANIPEALIYDTDIGGGLAYLDERIKRNGSTRIEVSSFADIKADIRARSQSGEIKKYKTVAIDHLTGLHQEAVLRHNPNLVSDFGRSGEAATREWRQVREMCKNMDFNLVCVSHLKAKYEDEKKMGVLSDGAKNLEGDFSIVLHLKRQAKYPSLAVVYKWRRDPEDARGPVPQVFPFTIDDFCKIACTDLKGARVELVTSTPEQLAEYKALLAKVQIDPKILEKWSKVEAEDMSSKQLQERIEFIKKTIGG